MNDVFIFNLVHILTVLLPIFISIPTFYFQYTCFEMAQIAEAKKKKKHPNDKFDKSVECPIEGCSRKYDYLTSLKRHLVKKHQLKEPAHQEYLTPDILQGVGGADSTFKYKTLCPEPDCKSKFFVQYSMSSHLSTVHGYMEDEVRASILELESGKTRQPDRFPTRIRCRLCPKIWSRLSVLKKHLEKIHGMSGEELEDEVRQLCENVNQTNSTANVVDAGQVQSCSEMDNVGDNNSVATVETKFNNEGDTGQPLQISDNNNLNANYEMDVNTEGNGGRSQLVVTDLRELNSNMERVYKKSVTADDSLVQDMECDNVTGQSKAK